LILTTGQIKRLPVKLKDCQSSFYFHLGVSLFLKKEILLMWQQNIGELRKMKISFKVLVDFKENNIQFFSEREREKEE